MSLMRPLASFPPRTLRLGVQAPGRALSGSGPLQCKRPPAREEGGAKLGGPTLDKAEMLGQSCFKCKVAIHMT